ncbi:hypothetical protein [Phycicoccus avicenniae]|uniref:hypothetical protein n=1 Tax=Phycicoccus avicenniae TaxID=2828860 RepID=UPI003D28EAF9
MSRRREFTEPTTDDLPSTPVDEVRKALDTIARGWRHVLDPIRTTGAGVTQTGIRPATEEEHELPPDARLDTPRVLAFWVHAALDEWPTILQTLVEGEDGRHRLETTESIDCTDVPAMARLLHREADRIVAWVEPGHDFGRTFTEEVTAIARAVERVAWPPKGDRLTIGECPDCGRRVRVKAPTWRQRPVRVPVPTTDPTTLAEWTWIVPDSAEWAADRDKPIRCRCGLEGTLEEWRARIAGPPRLLTAEELVVEVRTHLGLRYQPASVRQWQRRGFVQRVDYSPQGHARYDRTQVFAALIAREKQRDRAS